MISAFPPCPPCRPEFCANRLAASGVAKVRILSTGEVGTVYPPGRDDTKQKLLVNVGTVDRPRIISIKPDKVELLPAEDDGDGAAKKTPLRILPACIVCGAGTTKKCMECKEPICSAECAKKGWKDHKGACRKGAARWFGGCREGGRGGGVLLAAAIFVRFTRRVGDCQQARWRTYARAGCVPLDPRGCGIRAC